MNPIPVIGTAVVTNPYWVNRLLFSIDYPVDNFLIINNNGKGEIDDELDSLTKVTHRHVKKIKVCHMPANIGCAGAWNLIIKCHMMSPYWIIVNDDVAFNKGLLGEMAKIVEEDQSVGMVHGYPGDFNLGSWDMFLIRDHIVAEFGLFDENTYPAYCEDVDYLMRFMHRPIKRVTSLKSGYLHGDGDPSEYYTKGSQTSESSEVLKKKLIDSKMKNFDFLTEKWGDGWHVCGPTFLPFSGKSSVSTTNYDLGFVRRKNTGF